MNEKTFRKRFDKMEKALYEKVFLKNLNVNDVIKKGLEKHIKFIIFANLRFTLMYKCFKRAIDENLYKEDLNDLNRSINKICVYLDEILEIITDIINKEK